MTDDIDYDKYRNPMRMSLLDQDVDVEDLGIIVTKIELRPSEGDIYLHWREP